MGYNPSFFVNYLRNPVESVTWCEAAAFCNALSRHHGLAELYEIAGTKKGVACAIKPDHHESDYYKSPGYRLPTEAEWEYACRAGTTTPYYGDVEQIAWSAENYPTLRPLLPASVRSKKPNAWELYDMLGNVWEWCADMYRQTAYMDNSIADPFGKYGWLGRVVRGGSWRNQFTTLRASNRYNSQSSGDHIGFRVARSVL